MTSSHRTGDSPIMTAAQKALETGNADHILPMVPEESAGTVRNLLERACCSYRIRKDSHDTAVVWYYRTVGRLHAAWGGHRSQ